MGNVLESMEAVGEPDTQIVWEVKDLRELATKWTRLCNGETLVNELIPYQSKRAKTGDRFGIVIGSDMEIYLQWQRGNTTLNVYNERPITPEVYEWITGQPFQAIQDAIAKISNTKCQPRKTRKLIC
jgi:hypothetical protein